MAQWEFATVTRLKNDVWINYMHPDGKVTKTPPWKPKGGYEPVFAGLLAYLGGRDWELVSVQHGLSGIGQPDGGNIRNDDITAYLKRPVVPGRATDQPPIPSILWS